MIDKILVLTEATFAINTSYSPARTNATARWRQYSAVAVVESDRRGAAERALAEASDKLIAVLQDEADQLYRVSV